MLNHSRFRSSHKVSTALVELCWSRWSKYLQNCITVSTWIGTIWVTPKTELTVPLPSKLSCRCNRQDNGAENENKTMKSKWLIKNRISSSEQADMIYSVNLLHPGAITSNTTMTFKKTFKMSSYLCNSRLSSCFQSCVLTCAVPSLKYDITKKWPDLVIGCEGSWWLLHSITSKTLECSVMYTAASLPSLIPVHLVSWTATLSNSTQFSKNSAVEIGTLILS